MKTTRSARPRVNYFVGGLACLAPIGALGYGLVPDGPALKPGEVQKSFYEEKLEPSRPVTAFANSHARFVLIYLPKAER